MALISCPECSKNISDKVKSCPHCGYPLVEDDNITQKVEITSVNLKIDKKRKKKIIITIFIIVLLIIIVLIGYYFYSIQNLKKINKEYESNINLVMAKMLSSGSDAESLMNLTSKVWYNAIYEKSDAETDKYTKAKYYGYNNFDDSITNLFADISTIQKVSKIETSQDSIKIIMKKLQNPSEEYKKTYDTLIELFSSYQGIIELAINPKGNLTSYNNSKSEKIDKFMELYEKIQTQLPTKE